MRFLFLKRSLAWPRASGHDVHCYGMMRALARLGHEVSLAVVERSSPQAFEGLTLRHRFELDAVGSETEGYRWTADTALRARFRSYWGIAPRHVAAVRQAAEIVGADVVVSVGLDGLPCLLGVDSAARVWYAADEWVLHHLSQIPRDWSAASGNLRAAIIKGAYERAHASLLDRVWVVSEAERRAMRWFAGVRGVDVVPNGVDTEHFAPIDVPETPRTAVFWGRLDFGPNIQALGWFCRTIWPRVRQEAPDAGLTIVGARPSPEVTRLAGQDGVSIVPDLEDLRSEACRHALVVLPFVSGGGIKNKLLEAAAMGRPIVCTPRACGGLHGNGDLPFVVVRRETEWARQMLALWSDAGRRRQIGSAARAWVQEHHTWEAAARGAAAGLEQAREVRRGA